MAELLRAELQKAVGNRWTTGFLLWVFPVGALGFSLIMIVLLLLVPAAREEFMATETVWTEQFVTVWSFPSNVFGRALLLGFTAVVFAGEYQWGTWKNVVPRQQRRALILAKFLTVGLLVIVAFTVMSLIWGSGQGIMAVVAGVDYGPPLTGAVVSAFVANYLLVAGLAFVSVVIGAGYVALTAMLMRSILGGVLVGLAITVAEPVSLFGLFGLSRLLGMPMIVQLFRFSPFYNLDNAHSWMANGEPSQLGTTFAQVSADYTFSDSLAFSLFFLALWFVGLIVLNVFLFQRQDITA